MTSLVDFYNFAYAEALVFEAATVELSLLYGVDSQEFTEQFKRWIDERPIISWRDGIEILRTRFSAGKPLPWANRTGG